MSVSYIQESAVHVAKWGNSLAIRLPKTLVDQLGLKNGDAVSLVAVGEKSLAIQPDRRRDTALVRLAEIGLTVPAHYKFDRNEASER